MKNVLVGVFHSAAHAHEAHRTLLDQGFRNGQVGVDAGGFPPAGQALNGFAGVIARMFSGFIADGDPLVRAYHDTLTRGGGIVALHDLDETEEARARAILRRHGAGNVETLTPLASHARPAGGSLSNAERELAAVATMGPGAYVLPNAPVDWYGGRSPASVAQTGDPARPQEELDDTVGLDPELDRERLAARANRKR
jgi:hypothetical protein